MIVDRLNRRFPRFLDGPHESAQGGSNLRGTHLHGIKCALQESLSPQPNR
jgi:hypothetical protein